MLIFERGRPSPFRTASLMSLEKLVLLIKVKEWYLGTCKPAFLRNYKSNYVMQRSLSSVWLFPRAYRTLKKQFHDEFLLCTHLFNYWDVPLLRLEKEHEYRPETLKVVVYIVFLLIWDPSLSFKVLKRRQTVKFVSKRDAVVPGRSSIHCEV